MIEIENNENDENFDKSDKSDELRRTPWQKNENEKFSSVRLREWRLKLRDENLCDKRQKIAKDSSIKKVNSLLRKLRLFNSQNSDNESICTEIKKLKLSKYISEIISILSDLDLSQNSQILNFVEICSVLSQEYDDFTDEIQNRIIKQMAKEFKAFKMLKEDEIEDNFKAFITKQRKNLRLITEFIFVGIIENDALLIDILKSIIKKERKKDRLFVILSLISHFCRYAGEECSFLTNKLNKGKNNEGDLLMEEATYLEAMKLLKNYFKKCSDRLVEFGAFNLKNNEENIEILKRDGTLSNFRIEKLKEGILVYNKYHSYIIIMSKYLNLKMPETNWEEKNAEEDLLEQLQMNISTDSKPQMFDDEQMRILYEDLPDLTLYIKSTENETNENQNEKNDKKEKIEKKLKKNKKEKEENNKKEKIEKKLKKNKKEKEKNDMIEKIKESKKKKKEIIKQLKTLLNIDYDPKLDFDVLDNSNKKVGFPLLLEDLHDADNKQKIDFIAERYCAFDNEVNRMILIKTLLAVKEKHLGRIVFYSRLISTLSNHFKEIKEEMKDILETRFFGMLLNSKKTKMGLRMKNICFVAELTKFEVFPTTSTFKIINKCFASNINDDIHLGCALLENCGRWLYKNPKTNGVMINLLNKMKEMQNKKGINSSVKAILEMARNQCCPPPIRRKEKIESLPPEKAFLRYILQKYLNKENLNSALRYIRKMNWNDKVLRAFIIDSFIQAISYSIQNLSLIAALIASLDSFYNIGEEIVEIVIEEIHQGLEDNLVFLVQRRQAFIHFIGELYTYFLLDEFSLLNVLYLILSCRQNPPVGFEKLQSGPEFKVHLVCILLRSCSKYFANENKAELKKFLLHFEKFVAILKSQKQLDLETEFALEETFDAIAPKMRFNRNLEEIEKEILCCTGNKQFYAEKFEKTNDFYSSENIGQRTRNEEEIKSPIKNASNENLKDSFSESQDISSEGDESWKREAPKKSEHDILFEKEFDQTLKECIELRKYETTNITMLDSSTYLNICRSDKQKNKPAKSAELKDKKFLSITNSAEFKGVKNKKLINNDRPFNAKGIRVLTKRETDSKPILRQIGIEAKDAMFVIQKVDEEEIKQQQSLLKQAVVNEIIRREMEERQNTEDNL